MIPVLEFKGITFKGENFEPETKAHKLPEDLLEFYSEINGLVAYQGGLHVRGWVEKPNWHSLASVWDGSHALGNIYPEIRPGDIPFAQDFLGDQYLWRIGTIWHLEGSTGEIWDTELELFDFFEEIIKDPVEFLGLEPLIVFLEEGKKLSPGQLLMADPPFSEESDQYELSIMDWDVYFAHLLRCQKKDPRQTFPNR